jgi:tRNA nucleotidyltransferase (CCA-adding enzyme)
VNLRKEEYTQESRIPTMSFGTPEEDSLRRDLTINALFYNINTGEIEDFTKQGIQDLEAGLIRTPMEPEQTFKDDPLRVLRVFRFAARYNFKCDPDMLVAIQQPDIQYAFQKKISKERVGTEVEKGLQHQNQLTYLNHLHSVGLLPVMFQCPPSVREKYSDEALVQIFEKNSAFWTAAAKLSKKSDLMKTDMMKNDVQRRYLFVISALLHDFVV